MLWRDVMPRLKIQSFYPAAPIDGNTDLSRIEIREPPDLPIRNHARCLPPAKGPQAGLTCTVENLVDARYDIDESRVCICLHTNPRAPEKLFGETNRTIEQLIRLFV